MSGVEVVGSIAVFWALGLVTWKLLETKIKAKVIHSFETLQFQVANLTMKVADLERDHDQIHKLADETKKLLNQNTISNAFVHKNKRTELT